MAKLMWVLGVIFAAAGVALAIMVMTQPGLMQVYGLTLEVAAIAIVGGALAAGLGGVINALDAVLAQPHDDHHHHHAPSAAVVGGAVAATAATAAAAVESVAEKATTEVKVAAETAKSTVSETVAALEKAKDDITVALGGDKKPEEPPPVKVEEVKESSEEEEGTDDDTLYVVEEKTIRGRPARILSDGTVEAETDEGWMRFENMEHLDEYLDATGEDKA